MKDTNIYSRWLKKELSESELAELKASGDLDILEKIIEETDSWDLPSLKDNSYQRIQSKISSVQNEESEVVSINKPNYWAYGIAASVLMVLVSTYFIFFTDNTKVYQSQAGQKLTINLPDKTVVTLNGQSSISLNEDDFLENRKIKLTGEGYFDVSKKGDFKVEFANGEVKVLGTRFNILSGNKISTVKCFEGKVMVSDKNQHSEILNSAQGVRIKENETSPVFDLADKNPEWLSGFNSFKNAPLSEVITSLSIQFGIKFATGNIDLNRNYTGKFIHSDLDTALSMVFEPMGIKYEIEYSGKKPTRIILQ